MNTLVITLGPASKHTPTPEPVRAEDLALPALEMDASRHHRLVVEGVQAVWERWGRSALDVAILSAGLDLLGDELSIAPDDVTLEESSEGELARWAGRLWLVERVQPLVAQYDLVFYLLSGRPLAALGLPLGVPDKVQQIVLTDAESLSLLPDLANLHGFVADGGAAAQRWHVKASYVRGFLFKRLCSQVAWHGPIVLQWLHSFPQDTEKLFYKRIRWRPQLPMW
jgi:hypothetical protein